MRLHDALDYWAREQPDAEFAVQSDRCLTYREALAEANRLANALLAAGLRTGDRVALLAKNSPEYVLWYYGSAKAGVALVPLNYRLAPPEWSYIVDDAGARLLVAGPDYIKAIEQIRGELAGVERFIDLGGGGRHGWDDYQEWVGSHPAVPPDRFVAEEDDAYQMYTSGTTGRPKGAVLTHRAVTANLAQIAAALQLRPGERGLVVTPMFHAGTVFSTFSAVYGGGCVYVLEDFNPAEVVRVLSEERVAVATLVAAMIQACLNAVPDVAERRYDDLRVIQYGASPIAEPTLRRALEVFRCDFLQAYGMTEVSIAATFLMPADHRRALAERPELLLSAGRPVLGTEVRIVDATDTPVPIGTTGEILVRGPQLMRGYWNLPEATAEALRGGWMHTGDAGTLDAAGYLYILDRVKDMIVSGGENVYPREVEEVLFEHPAIADAAVIGVPDERWGETVKAVVVRRAGASVTEAEIVDFCRGRLAGFKRPRSVDFVDALPRTPTGKVLKRDLREPYWADQQRRVAGA